MQDRAREIMPAGRRGEETVECALEGVAEEDLEGGVEREGGGVGGQGGVGGAEAEGAPVGSLFLCTLRKMVGELLETPGRVACFTTTAEGLVKKKVEILRISLRT